MLGRTVFTRGIRIVPPAASVAKIGSMVNAYGTDLHGLIRGPTCTVPEPDEVWLSVMGAAMPFRTSAAIVTMDDDPVTLRVIERASSHFGHCHPCPLLRTAPSASSAASSPLTPRRIVGGAAVDARGDGKMDGALVPPDLRSSYDGRNEVATMSDAVIADLLEASPFQRVSDGALDVVCFGPGTFRQILPWAPHYVTEASRVLRPHGVMAVLAQRKGRLVGPQPLSEDFESMKDEITSACPDSGCDSEEIGFEGIAFPQSNVKRRWFTSEYPIPNLSMLAAYVRSWPEYHQYATPAGDEEAIGAMRTRQDPLEALLRSIDAHLESLADRNGKLPELGSMIRLEVDHCIVTCDTRPSNKPPIAAFNPRVTSG